MTLTDADRWRASSPLTAFLSREAGRAGEVLAARGGPALYSSMNAMSESSM